MNSAEEIEKAMLLQQSGEISLADLRRLESTLKTDCRARETKKMNNVIIKASQQSLSDTPLDELTRARILEAARDAITEPKPKSALPWMAAAAVLLLALTLVWAAWKTQNTPGTPNIAHDDPPAPLVVPEIELAQDDAIDRQLDELEAMLAALGAETGIDPSLDQDLDELAAELLLLEEMQI